MGDIVPLPPTPTPTTQSFTGALQKNGAITFTFTEAIDGTIAATLTSLSPQPDITLSMTVGAWDGTTCSTGVAADAAAVNTVLQGSAAAGNYCVRLADNGGKVTDTENVAVTVVHY